MGSARTRTESLGVAIAQRAGTGTARPAANETDAMSTTVAATPSASARAFEESSSSVTLAQVTITTTARRAAKKVLNAFYRRAARVMVRTPANLASAVVTMTVVEINTKSHAMLVTRSRT